MIGDHTVIRHAYENALTACARLSAFATCIPTASQGLLINARQDIPAIDDLVAFATNARRLLENTRTKQCFCHIAIPAVSGRTADKVPKSLVITHPLAAQWFR
jgi:hypothetical protein